MAISIDYIRPWTQAIATAGQTVFSTIWTADAATDVLVYARGTGVEARDVDQLVLSIDYTVQFIGAGLTVQITFLAGRTLDDVITITRDTPPDKMNLYTNTNFLPSMLNSDFERLVMMIQTADLYDKDLAPRYNTSETPYGVDENNPPNFNRIIDLYLPLLPPLHVWRKNAANTMIEAVLFAGGGGDPGGPITVPQPTDDLYDGAWVRWDLVTGQYILAMANNAVNAEVAGCVASVTDANNFILQQNGPNETTFGAFPQGIYFLSTTIAGGMSLSLPQNDGEVNIPVLDKTDGALAMVMNKRGKIVGTQDPGPGTGENEIIVVQPAHGFSVEQAVRADPGTPGFFVLALSDTEVNAQAVGVITEIIDVDTFRLQSHGYTSAFGGGAGVELWYLSDITPGLISNVIPTASTSFTKPMFVVSTAGAGFILEDRIRSNAVADTNIIVIPQRIPGEFALGDWVRPSSSGDDYYVLGLADTLENSRVTGMVIAADVTTFVLQTEGFTNALTGGVGNGEDFWLSATVAGTMTNVEPTANGQISKIVFKGSNATDNAGYILEQRPMVQPNANGGVVVGNWGLLATQTVAGVTSIDFPMIISDNPALTEFDVRFIDTYGNVTHQQLYVQYYIGGVLQVTGYQSQIRVLHTATTIVTTSTAARLTMLTTNTLKTSLLDASSGRMRIYAPSTNGTHKVAEGTTLLGYSNANALGDRLESMTKMISNSAPLEGVNINSGGVALLTGTFSIYAR